MSDVFDEPLVQTDDFDWTHHDKIEAEAEDRLRDAVEEEKLAKETQREV